MTTIKEAFAAIEECAEDELDAAVRVFGLAVLEKAALLGGDHGVELTDEYWTIRQKLEELR